MSEMLCDKTCVACKGGVPPLTAEEIAPLAEQVPEWTVVDHHHLRRIFKFPDFVAALAMVNRVGALAEQQRHHPVITLTWGRITIEIWTHKIDGLTESDFVLAAKIDRPTADGASGPIFPARRSSSLEMSIALRHRG